jgi:uncharacterized iron-regulated membrane protein
MATASAAIAAPVSQPWLDHRTVWRWHFYAGLLCFPFVIWLACTGTVFLFSPQIQAVLDRHYTHLSTAGPAALVNDQVKAALAAVPGSNLHSYELPRTPTSPANILVGKELNEFRVYVNPRTLEVLKIDNEDRRVDKFVFRLHGELLSGARGSAIVELAASWTVIMIVTGLFLWWPTNTRRLGGVLYPRLNQGGRIFWKDIHSVVGIYVSFFALFLLFTGLPWAKSWGSYLKAVRKITNTAATGKQDWTTSSAQIVAARAALNNDPMGGTDTAAKPVPAAKPDSMAGMDMTGMDMSSGEHAGHGAKTISKAAEPNAYVAIDTMYASVAPLNLPYPVLISPPKKFGGNWTAKSDTRDRPLRVDLVLDGKSGTILNRTDFNSKPWLDRVIGSGIAAHEGALFGVANQILGLFTTCGLVLLSVSGVMMWRRRKPEGVLGAPVPIRKIPWSGGLIAIMIAFGLYFPFLGGSMILVGLAERFILRKIPGTRRWLGLFGAQPAAV